MPLPTSHHSADDGLSTPTPATTTFVNMPPAEQVDPQEDIHAIRVTAGAADLVLGCDLVVTGTKKVLASVLPGKTWLAVNTAEVMPGDFARNADFSLPAERIKRAIAAAAGADARPVLSCRRQRGTARTVHRAKDSTGCCARHQPLTAAKSKTPTASGAGARPRPAPAARSLFRGRAPSVHPAAPADSHSGRARVSPPVVSLQTTASRASSRCACRSRSRPVSFFASSRR